MPGRVGRGDPVGGAQAVADAADAGEIKLALEVARARHDLGRHRIKHRLEADAVAGIELIALRGDMHTHAARLIARIEAGQRVGLDDDAPALLHLVDIDDPPGDGDRPEMALQHRRLALPGGLPHQCKAGRQGGERKRRFAPPGMPAQRNHQGNAGDRGRDAGPQRRLDFQRKIDCDPSPEIDRQPEQAAVALGG